MTDRDEQRLNAPKKRPMKSYPMNYPADTSAGFISDSDEDMSDDDIVPPSNPTRASKMPAQRAQKAPVKAPPPKAGESGSDNDDDDDDDDDSELDSEENSGSEASGSDAEQDAPQQRAGKRPLSSGKRPPQKRPEAPPPKKKKRNQFIEEEAEVDEDSDEELYADSDADLDDDAFINEAEDALKLQPQIYRDLDSRREREEGRDGDDIDAVTQRLKDRYGRGSGAYSSQVAGAYVGDSAGVPMQFLLPTPKDSNLWCIKCRPGKERDICRNLMRKAVDYSGTAHPLRISSVVTRDNLKGYVYVEARSQADVQFAMDKMNHVYISKITLVPLEEMVDVMTVKSKSQGLKIGAWVRVSRGKYKGDLAQIQSSDNPDRVEIKMIPRSDYGTAPAAIRSKDPADDGKKRKLRIRPTQRFFNPKDVPSNQSISKVQGLWLWNGDRFDKDGFLVKEVNVISLEVDGVTPTLDEISKFSVGSGGGSGRGGAEESVDVSNLEIAKDEFEGQFAIGDRVIVTEGDLINAHGTVQHIGKNMVTLQMADEELGLIEVETRKLTRSFIVGDHVKIIRGKYKDETGMITQLNGGVVSVFSDATMTQFSVFGKDVRTSADVSVTEHKTDAFSVHDLVQIGLNNVGVVVKVEREQYRVMDLNGAIRAVKAQEITQKRDSKKAVALDINQNTVHAGDVIEIVSGEHSGKQASILHLYRVSAFLLSKDVPENSGVLVTKSRMVRLVGGKDQVRGGAANPSFSMPAPPSRDQIALNRNRNNWIHKPVTIIRGPYKGYQGIVKDFTEKGAKVELHTNAKVVTVDPTHLAVKDGSGSISRGGDYGNNSGRGADNRFSTAKTPGMFQGSQTPSHFDSGTARTPAWDIGSKTPMHYAARDADNMSFETAGGARGSGAYGMGQTPMGDAAYGLTPASAPTPRSAPIPSANLTQQMLEIGTDWLVKDIEVRFVSGNMEGQVGAIVDCSPDGKTGQILLPSNQTFSVSAVNLIPVQPAKKDKCVFIFGQHKGSRGTLIGIDSDTEDAIVKLVDSTSQFTIASIGHVCKLRDT